MRLTPFSVLAAFVLSGCGVGTVVNVVTAPIRVAGKAADLATTSQSESDENRGRSLRQLEGRYARLDSEYRKEEQRCADGRSESCARRDSIRAEMDAIREQLPVRPN